MRILNGEKSFLEILDINFNIKFERQTCYQGKLIQKFLF